MSEKEKIQAEYNALCAEAGHINFQLRHILYDRLEVISNRLKELNKLAVELAAKPVEQGKGE
jgi:hypothetical protein